MPSAKTLVKGAIITAAAIAVIVRVDMLRDVVFDGRI